MQSIYLFLLVLVSIWDNFSTLKTAYLNYLQYYLEAIEVQKGWLHDCRRQIRNIVNRKILKSKYNNIYNINIVIDSHTAIIHTRTCVSCALNLLIHIRRPLSTPSCGTKFTPKVLIQQKTIKWSVSRNDRRKCPLSSLSGLHWIDG